MIKAFSRVTGIFFVCFSLCVFANKQEFKNNPPDITPFQAAAIAYASYKHHKHEASNVLGSLCSSKFEVLEHKEHASKDGAHKHLEFNTTIIVVKDKQTKQSYVAIEGGHNSHKVTEKDIVKINKIIQNIKEKYALTIAAFIGHTRGGIIAKHITCEYASRYPRVQVIGFNAPEQTKSGTYYALTTPKNEINFACFEDDFDQAKKTINCCGNDVIKVTPSSLIASEKKEPMKCFLKPLEEKSWKEIVK